MMQPALGVGIGWNVVGLGWNVECGRLGQVDGGRVILNQKTHMSNVQLVRQ